MYPPIAALVENDSESERDKSGEESSENESESSDEETEDKDTEQHTALIAQLDAAVPCPPFSEDSEGGTSNQQTTEQDSWFKTISFTQQLIEGINGATLDADKLDRDVIDQLRSPITEPVDISDPDIRLSLDLFMACNSASEATYASVRDAVLRRSPDFNVLSHYRAKKLVAEISGVVSTLDDMCINSCTAFVGPLAEAKECPECQEPRYKLKKSGKEVPRQQACTIPLGPQLQALRRSPQGAAALTYRDRKTREILKEFQATPMADRVYDDIFSGSDLRQLATNPAVAITADDITVSFSLDGAQLYQNKKSDTWIAIWVINDYDPKMRFKRKHILPALIIPGPNKPKNLDAFLFRSFYHLAALQHENDGRGMQIWNALDGKVALSRVFFALATADAVGLAEIDGRVGHHGARACRVGCDMKGRHKPGSGHYCAAHLRPDGSDLAEKSNHPDYDFSRHPTTPSTQTYIDNLNKVVNSLGKPDFEKNRYLTGISKPSIISGLDKRLTLPVPRCFTVDLMHLLFINIAELLIPLWRGTLRCDPTDSKATWDWVTLVGRIWTEHGRLVAAATQYFPSFFHRPPRNPAEKISSGYKATEYFLYLFGLGPGFFRVILPKKYWKHFCKLVHGVRIIIQRSITGKQLREAHAYLTMFVWEFEVLYYQRRMDRLHFCRPCLHTLLHTSLEVTRVGPGACSSQFVMERAIGDLGGEIKQPSNIFGNLCQIALRRSQLNALKNACPELDDSSRGIPKFAHNCGNSFVLLRPRDRYRKSLTGPQLTTVNEDLNINSLRRWGRLCLPNGQIARSLFSEKERSERTRISRNVKVILLLSTQACTNSLIFKITLNGKIEFAEIQFFFLHEDENQAIPYALVSMYGPPDADLLEDSSRELWACEYQGDSSLKVIRVSAIVSVVSMQLLPKFSLDEFGGKSMWFVIEKSGLDDTELTGYIDSVLQNADDSLN